MTKPSECGKATFDKATEFFEENTKHDKSGVFLKDRVKFLVIDAFLEGTLFGIRKCEQVHER